MANYNSTTRLLMSAVHLYPDDFKEDIKERLEHPYKAPTPEFGIDLDKIREELDNSKGDYFKKSTFLFIVVLVALFILFQDIENNWGILILAFFLTFLAELIYLRTASKKVRKIMNIEGDNCHFDEDSSKNIIISGGYYPFVGSGWGLNSWSFTVDLSQPENKEKPVNNINVTELYNKIEVNLKKLNIEGLLLKDKLLVNGMDVNIVSHLLTNGRFSKPVDTIDSNYVKTKINENDKSVRYYKAVYIPIWEGKLFLHLYYRFMIVNGSLFTEAKFFSIPPLKQKYRDIENIPIIPTKREFIEHIYKSLFTGAFSWIAVYVNVFAFVQGGFMAKNSRLKAWKREVETTRLYNYGWNISLREKWSENTYERYFQQVDRDFMLKILTNEVIKNLQHFLSENNIATDQFKETTTKIVNEGIMIYGGQVQADSLAAGKGAIINNKKG